MYENVEKFERMIYVWAGGPRGDKALRDILRQFENKIVEAAARRIEIGLPDPYSESTSDTYVAGMLDAVKLVRKGAPIYRVCSMGKPTEDISGVRDDQHAACEYAERHGVEDIVIVRPSSRPDANPRRPDTAVFWVARQAGRWYANRQWLR